MAYELTIEPMGAKLEIEEGQTILDAALRAGIYIPNACGHGLCGTCKVQVLDGEIEHGQASSFALMDFERDEGMTLACCATLNSDVTIEAEIEEDADAEQIPVRDFPGTVSRVVDLTPTIKGVFIALDEPIHFQAGQYIQFAVPGKGIERAFSLANAPSSPSSTASEIEINVRIVAGGEGTTYIHNQLKVGDGITVKGPYGRFFVHQSARKPLVFMAGGSGLSSPRSMILDLLNTGWDLPITLIYGQRNRAELYYHDEFVALAAKHPNFRYVPTLSDEPADSEWNGHRGYVHDAATTTYPDGFTGNQAYLCGPPLMIDACINALMQGRLFEDDIYFEKFISAADAQQVRSPLFRKI
jgi:phenol hydroxylase P5 protein